MKIILFDSFDTVEVAGMQPIVPFISLPDSAILRNGNPVYLPDFDSEFSAIPCLAVKINRLGKNIAPKFAGRYYSEAAPVIILRADNIMRRLKERAMPLSCALGFDKSVVIGDFIDVDLLPTETLSISYNGEKILPAISEEMINNAIHHASRYNSLKMGDIILIPFSLLPIPLRIDTLFLIKRGTENILRLPIK